MNVRVNTADDPSKSNKNSVNFDLVTSFRSFAGAFVPGGPQAGYSHAKMFAHCINHHIRV